MRSHTTTWVFFYVLALDFRLELCTAYQGNNSKRFRNRWSVWKLAVNVYLTDVFYGVDKQRIGSLSPPLTQRLLAIFCLTIQMMSSRSACGLRSWVRVVCILTLIWANSSAIVMDVNFSCRLKSVERYFNTRLYAALLLHVGRVLLLHGCKNNLREFVSFQFCQWNVVL